MSTESNIHTTTRRGRFTLTRRRKATIAVAAAIVVTTPAMAAAVIDTPPQAPLEVVVFPSRDFVVTEGGPEGLALRFEIIRNGVVIGTANSSQVSPAITTDAAGLLEVNHPGGLCWSGVTPNIRPGDVLRVTDEANSANGYQVTTQNVRATAAEIVGNDVVVHGVATINGGNTPLPLSRVEQRIVNPELREPPEPLEKRDLRATTDDRNLVRDNSPGAPPGAFIATHSGLTAVQRQKAIEGQTRVLGWMRTAANGDRLGLTIFEEDEIDGPGFGGCPQSADYAVTSFNRPSIKVGHNGLTVSGTSNDATDVQVKLVDGAAATSDPSKAATITGSTFKAAFTKAQVNRLRDGRLRAVGSFTVGGTAINGVVKSIVKDLKAPRPAQSDTRSGVYQRAQSVNLFRAAGEPRTSRIFYTTNGRTPGLGALRFARSIRVTATHTIRAVVVDQAGNKSVSNCKTHVGCWRIAVR
jgi:large repetitive protein